MGQYGDDIMGGMSAAVSDIYMAPTIDKSLRLENDLNEQLMNLSLVDISGSLNSEHKLSLVIDEKGRLISCNNATVEYIFKSNSSFKLIS